MEPHLIAGTATRRTLKQDAETGFRKEVLDRFYVRSYRHASTILEHDFKEQYDEIVEVLRKFRLPYSQCIVGGGGKGPIAVNFDAALKEHKWYKANAIAETTVHLTVRPGGQARPIKLTEKFKSPSHEIDRYRNGIAVEMEWNNKTEFYDRDLDNFRKLHELGVVSVGIIVTRSTELDEEFDKIDALLANFPFRPNDGDQVTKVSSKYGRSTTHADKLYDKIDGRSGGECPILVFAIKSGAPVAHDDYSPLIERLRKEGKTEVTKEDLPDPNLAKELEQEEEDTRAAEAQAESVDQDF